MHDSIQDLERLESELLRKQKSNFLMNLPLDVDGTHILPKLPKREKWEIFLNHKQIDEDFMASKFHGMIQQFYTAIAQKDYDTLDSLSEKRFADRVKKATDEVNTKSNKLEFTPHETAFEETGLDQRSYIFDKIFEKGVYFDREKNDSNYDYYLDSDLEQEGFRYYQHKYFAGYDNHYYLDRYVEQEANDPNARFRYKYLQEKRSRSMVFRMFGVIRNIGKFTSPTAKNLYSNEYTGNHLVIFENQLKEPPAIALTNPNIETWVKNHKINHDEWKITDIDNYMRGIWLLETNQFR